MIDELPTPRIVIDSVAVDRNLRRMADYARARQLCLRPHTKTHKSLKLARLQLDSGAAGLTVAKAGEAQVMAALGADLLVAYPAADPVRCLSLAALARNVTLRVAIDSSFAAQNLASAARAGGSTIGILVDLDVGMGRTGVQSPAEALALAECIARLDGLRLDGILFYPGHISGPAAAQIPALEAIDERLAETIDLWRNDGLEATIVSGGSTPTALQSHWITRLTEIRPGTYVFNDMNCVRGGCATLDDCAARIVATVVSNAVPGQVVVDAGSKTLTSDLCSAAPDSGFGHVVEYPAARIRKLTEEHGQIDVSLCDRAPRLGEQISIVPNHICPCLNLQNQFYWREPGGEQPFPVDARGRVT